MNAYHHGNLRAALVQNAVELAREKGPDGVVLREVARRTGVSHNAAYRHFADRGDLLVEVAATGLHELEHAMERRLRPWRSMDPVARARRRLSEVGRAYVHFALAEPGLFKVAYSQPSIQEAKDAGPYALLGRVLDELVDAGGMSAVHRPGAEVACWSAVHGFAVLHLDGPLRAMPVRERERQLEQMLSALELGLR